MIAPGSTNRGPRLDMVVPREMPQPWAGGPVWVQWVAAITAGRTLGLAGAVQLGSSSSSFFSLCLSIISLLSINIRHNGLHESRYLRPARLYGRSLHLETGCHPRLLFQDYCMPSPPPQLHGRCIESTILICPPVAQGDLRCQDPWRD